MKLQKFYMVRLQQKKLKKRLKNFEIGGIGTDLPEIKLKKNIKKWNKLLDYYHTKNIFLRKSEARRAIKGNALKINNIKFDRQKIKF